jgi:hypothetical protein
MAAGATLNAFLDWLSGTGVGRITTADHPLQLVTRHTFLWGRLWKNNGMPVDGGQNITFWFLPKTAGTFEEVLPGTPTTPKNPQVLQKGVLDHRFTRAHSTYVDQEFLLNDRVTSGNREVMFEQFVKIRDEKRTIRKTDVAIGMENQLSAVPNKTLMEGQSSTATSPYSIFAHINQGTNGLFGFGFGTSVAGGTWTVKEAIDPTSAAINSNMNVTQQKYASTTIDNPTNLIGGMDALRMEIDWEQPDSLSQYQADDALNNQMYLCTKQGRQAIMSLMRGDQDRYVMGAQDPSYPDPQFQGVPFKRWDPLETAAIYDQLNTGLSTEGVQKSTGNQSGGPRIYAVNGNYLYPVAHPDRLFFEDVPQRHLQVPDTYVQYETTWWQLVCKSYKHQGILFPSADTYVGNPVTQPNLYA